MRVVARRDDHLILGIQAVGARLSELAAAFGIAIEMGAGLEDIAPPSMPTRPWAKRSGSGALGLGHALHV